MSIIISNWNILPEKETIAFGLVLEVNGKKVEAESSIAKTTNIRRSKYGKPISAVQVLEDIKKYILPKLEGKEMNDELVEEIEKLLDTVKDE